MGCASRKSVIHSTEVITSSSNTDIHQETSTNKKRVHKLRPPNSTEERRLHHTTWSPTSSEHTVLPPTIEPSDQSKSSSNDFINVLLLGESGVGKSTFINAIVNYLKFDSIKDACSGQPIVLMPVSFLMTHGDHFQEQIVKFGNADPNEDHHHHGQSVTQCCRSYVFNVGTRNKLRLIDTPGMGDTRGLAQDDLNMQHILSFINNLSHLNAICILLKPNESKLNVVFRSYFTRLTSFLGENVRNNIIFCFTNTRTTFFTPGDTAPLLKKTLHDLPIKNIPFDKSNSFCFDSESFRYLVARLNGMNFDKYQQDEYKQSWITSVNESNRFLQYICSELKPFPQENWQSIDHAQFQINRLIRPILETTRNILRNIILLKEEPSKRQIKLCPKVIAQPATICTKCKRVPRSYSDFWILPDELHSSLDKCLDCEHSRMRHMDVEYKLDYDSSDNRSTESVDKMERKLDQLKLASLEFGYFFVYTTRTSKSNDPVMSYLNQITEEENQICQEKDSHRLNSTLHKKLNQMKEEYEYKLNNMLNRNAINLVTIYEQIESVRKIDLIKDQLDVIKNYQQKYMNEQEKRVL